MQNSENYRRAAETTAIASVNTPDLEMDPAECIAPEGTDPCTIVIMGATGDLTARKLMPALFHLYLSDGLPQPFQIVGCGRTPFGDREFRNKMHAAIETNGVQEQKMWSTFEKALHYCPLDYENLESYQKLAASLKDIDHVTITATETLGVEHRAGYYEKSGVLRDMFQNHMMQLLALTAMEPPSRFKADLVRDEKSKVFSALRPFPVDQLQNYLVLGQYNAGLIDNQRVPAYREEPGVDPDSLTPTYSMMKVFIDNWRWQGVPFYMTSGKRLDRKLTEIAIQFKTVPHSLFRHVLGETIVANRLTLGIYPEESIRLKFQTKNPGARMCLRTVTMDFQYQQNYAGPVLDAYEKVLIDCMIGDQLLFWRQDGVEKSWSFITPILDRCEDCDDQLDMLDLYPAGSSGPAATSRLGFAER